MKQALAGGLALAVFLMSASAVAQETARFDIQRFQIEGARIVPADELNSLVAPYIGPQREYGDIQRALDAIELAYRARGYAAVQIQAPEQELTGGTVRLQVVEALVDKVVVDGKSRYFDVDNLRNGLPALREGTPPNAHDLSAQIALNNENPAKQVEVVLGIGEREGTVDARLKVAESNPLKLSLSLDNTGTESTGRHRLGVSVQHANLWNRDHVGTVSWQTAPERPDQVHIYSLSYRLPVYAWAGALDVILAKSSVVAGVTPTTAGALSFAGSGTVFGLRYTHALPRHADTTQKLVLGWDVKAVDNTCSVGTFGSAGCGAAAADVTLRPLSLTYQRLMVAPGQATELNLTYSRNLPGGAKGNDTDFQAARPSPAGGTGARADFQYLRGSLTHLGIFDGDWQLRLVGTAQWSPRALLAQEQLGLAGSNAVRGFQEREVARDRGLLGSIEGYTPNLGDRLGLPGNLRALVFLDGASGSNRLLAGETQHKNSLASWGLGLRYGMDKELAARLDVAQVLVANGNQARGDWRGHFSLNLAY